MSDPFGLTADHRDLLREILATAGDRIDRVAVFGSRATGRYRPNSDLDLVLYGSADAADCDRLWTLLPLTLNGFVLSDYLDSVF